MCDSDWTTRTDRETVCKRAAGRRHYNAWRQFCASERRLRVEEMLHELRSKRGSQKRIAALLGVSESTISRDVTSNHRSWLNAGDCDDLAAHRLYLQLTQRERDRHPRDPPTR
jgi:IS30 family transposase